MEIAPRKRPLAGTCFVPGDKSISHRAALLAAMAVGTSEIRGFSDAADCEASLQVLTELGVSLERVGDDVVITGSGTLHPSREDLNCRRSGTTMRLSAGMLAGAPFRSVLTGDPQLLRRPMSRVAEPLGMMGARIELSPAGTAPLVVEGGELHGIEYLLPVASSQVKSAVLLAGLRASGDTSVVETTPTRDHTERILAWMGAPVQREGRDGVTVTRVSAGPIPPFQIRVPGDLSSAAPLLGAALLVPGSDVVVGQVGLNATRTGLLRVLERMGAAVELRPSSDDGPEPRGDVRVAHSGLRGTTVGQADIASMIDELPLVGVIATQAEGVTEVRGASELRVKESDRIGGLVTGLRTLGADIEELPDGFVVRGPTTLRGGSCDAMADHRLAMAFAVAALVATEPVTVVGMGYVADSFPGFLEMLENLG